MTGTRAPSQRDRDVVCAYFRTMRTIAMSGFVASNGPRAKVRYDLPRRSSSFASLRRSPEDVPLALAERHHVLIFKTDFSCARCLVQNHRHCPIDRSVVSAYVRAASISPALAAHEPSICDALKCALMCFVKLTCRARMPECVCMCVMPARVRACHLMRIRTYVECVTVRASRADRPSRRFASR